MAAKEKEKSERLQCTDYIQAIYLEAGYTKKEINWKLITSVLKNLLDEGLSYTGIIYTLWYCKEIAEINLFDEKANTILWCVPFYYKEAERYFEENQRITELIENFDFSDTERIVRQKERKKKVKLLEF